MKNTIFITLTNLNERGVFFAGVVVKVVEDFSRHEQQEAAGQVSVIGERVLRESDISKTDVKSLGTLQGGTLPIPLLASSVVGSLAGSQGQSTGQEQNCGLHSCLVLFSISAFPPTGPGRILYLSINISHAFLLFLHSLQKIL